MSGPADVGGVTGPGAGVVALGSASPALRLSLAELSVACELAGRRLPVGVAGAEVRRALAAPLAHAAATRSLLRRGVLRVGATGRPEAPGLLADLLGVASAPRRLVTVECEVGDEVAVTSLAVGTRLGVAIDVELDRGRRDEPVSTSARAPGVRVSLSPFAPQELLARALAASGLAGVPPIAGGADASLPAVEVPVGEGPALLGLGPASDGGTEGGGHVDGSPLPGGPGDPRLLARRLEAHGSDPVVAGALAATLAGPCRFLQVGAVQRPSGSLAVADAVAWLDGEAGPWPRWTTEWVDGPEPLLRLSPLSAPELAGAVAAAIGESGQAVA